MKTTMILRLITLFGLGLFLTSNCDVSAAEKTSAPCKAISKLKHSRSGLKSYVLQSIENNGEEYIPNIDIDGDGKNDEIRWSCPASENPSDPCSLSVELTSTGNVFQFEEWRFNLFKYQGNIYIDSSSGLPPNENINKLGIYKIDSTGILLVCPK